MPNDDVQLKDDGLNNLLRALNSPMPTIKVGIMGMDTERQDGALTNAEIGAKHEFGSPAEGLPVRSFLRMPLNLKFYSTLLRAGAFNQETLKKIISEKGLFSFAKKLGAVAVKVIDDAFASGGFGQWKPSNMSEKKVKMTLVETQQLRRSIDFKVEK